MNKLRQFIFASSNKGKIRELQQIATALTTVEIVPPTELMEEFGLPPSVNEGVESYIDNATIKASAFAKWCKNRYPVIADDTGIEVDYLDGYPGVLSARFGGEDVSSETKNSLILEKLKNVEDRAARFRCILVLIFHDNEIVTADECLEGFILDTPQGVGGFGYDPIFCPTEDNPNRLSLAELKTNVPDYMTHRKKAFRALWGKVK